MKMTISIGYALIAVEHIAQSKNKIVMSQTISNKYNIPLEYLLKIMRLLVKNNVLISKRGPSGGFYLAKPADQISMLQIYEAIEGPMINNMNLMEHAPRENFSKTTETVYDKAITAVKEIFEGTKVSELVA